MTFTPQQIKTICSYISVIDIKEYIASHPDEYKNFIEKEEKNK